MFATKQHLLVFRRQPRSTECYIDENLVSGTSEFLVVAAGITFGMGSISSIVAQMKQSGLVMQEIYVAKNFETLL